MKDSLLINKKYLDKSVLNLFNKKHIFINSVVGSGKTTIINEISLKYKKVFYISNRICLSEKLA